MLFEVSSGDKKFKNALAFNQRLNQRRGINVITDQSRLVGHNTIRQTYTINMFIAEDNSTQYPIYVHEIKRKSGNMQQKTYSHELYLIERTKFLESFVGDNLTFTNTLGRSYF